MSTDTTTISDPDIWTTRPELWARRLESNEASRLELLDKLVISLKPWLRAQMAKSGALNYWGLQKLAEEFSSGQISHDVLVSVAESLVQDGEWVVTKDAKQGDHWKPNSASCDIIVID